MNHRDMAWASSVSRWAMGFALIAACGGSLDKSGQTGKGGAVGTGEAGAVGTGGSISGDPGVAGNVGVGGDIAVGGRGGFTSAGSGGSAGIGGRAYSTCSPGGTGGIVTTGVGGDAGAGPPYDCAPSSPVCGSACGNGQQDTCMKAMTALCLARTDTEDCDGADLGGQSCASRGYGSGALGCNSDCEFDLGGCSECAPFGTTLTACQKLPFEANGGGSIALAATDTEVGLALLRIEPDGSPPLSFARLSPDLDVLDVVSLEAASPTWCNHRWVGVAAAPLSSGWVVAVAGDPEVFVHVLDGSGHSVARFVVDELPPYAAVGDPILVSQPGGGPLLVWPTDSGARAAVLSADGRSATAPITFPIPTFFSYSPIGAAYLAGNFYFIQPQPAGSSGSFTLARVSSDGQDVTVSNLLPGETAYLAGFSAGTADLRLLYTHTSPGYSPNLQDVLLFRRISPAGEPLIPAVPIGAWKDVASRSTFAIGDDTATLFGSSTDTYSERLGMMRLAADGTAVGPPQPIVSVPNQVYLESPVAARRGPDVIVAWKKNFMLKGVSIARLTP